MRSYQCDQEQKVFDAVQSGVLDSSLRDHISRCAICADVAMVTQFLREQSNREEPEIDLPDAGLLWWKAQLRARDAALARATRPIDLVTKVGSTAAGLAGLWFTSTSSGAREWIANLIHLQILQHAGGVYWGELALLGGIGVIVCILAGSLFTLRA